MNPNNPQDIAPDQVPVQSWDQLVAGVAGVQNYNGGLSIIGKPFQSPNFIAGVSGWQLDSNGILTAVGAVIGGYVINSKGAFGGDGTDGAIAITAGVTTIDAASAAVVIKNYTSISITGTASLTISNPHANGTILILKSQGGVTITSSTVPAITMKGMGGTGGPAGASTDSQGSSGNPGNSNFILQTNPGQGGGGSFTTSGEIGGARLGAFVSNIIGLVPLSCGAGGGGGGFGSGSSNGAGGGGGASATAAGTNGEGGSGANAAASAGGRGGGALYIQCLGSYTASSTLSVAGNNGTNGVGDGSGGGGGAGGTLIVLYNTLVSDSGTYTVTAGSGGTGSETNAGGAGGAGYGFIGLNNIFA